MVMWRMTEWRRIERENERGGGRGIRREQRANFFFTGKESNEVYTW